MINKLYTGTVSGEKANAYLSHVYRTAVIEPLTIHDFDPDRLYYDKEYPRWTSGVDTSTRRIESHIDYAVAVAHDIYTLVTRVTVIARANRYTAAKEDAEIFSMTIDGMGLIGARDLVDEALRDAFK